MAIAAFVVLMLVFIAAIALGERGGESFFDNLWLTVPFLAAYGAAVAAFGLGVFALAAQRERHLVVVAATLVGLLVTAFGVAEIAFPH